MGGHEQKCKKLKQQTRKEEILEGSCKAALQRKKRN
jgi:hypothetical protein